MSEEEKQLKQEGFVLVGDNPLKPKLWVNKYAMAQMSDREIEEMSKVLAKRRFSKR